MPERHLARLFREAARQHGHRVATRIRRGNGWRTLTYERATAEVDALARIMIDLGIEPGARVAIYSPNRPEWTIADFATLTAGAVVVPVYTTSTPDQVSYLLRHSGAELVFVAGQVELDVVKAVWPDTPEVRHVIVFDSVTADDPRVHVLDEVRAVPPTRESADLLEQRLAEASPDDLASIIYTSGTTGDPKGVMLRHSGFADQMVALDEFFAFGPPDHSLCFLPLAHSFERAWTFAVLTRGCMNTYCPDPRSVAEMLKLVKPTMLVSVPRLFEKVYSEAYGSVAGSAAKLRLFRWAVGVGAAAQARFRAGKTPGAVLDAQLRVADRLVLSKIRTALGPPKAVMACGGAPLRIEVEEFIGAAGLALFPGYGLTEASALISFNAPGGQRPGSVGRVMNHSEVMIARGGEIWYRGPNMMAGYWRDPESTAEAIVEGWLRTGDIGHIDSDGFLFITDRLKDLIVTSGGKNVAPAPIEGALLADPLFEQAVVLGDSRPFLTLLVKPALPQLEAVAEALQITWSHHRELVGHPQIVDEVRRRVALVSAKLPRYEQIRDLRLLLEEFTMENGLLTPTLKVRRREVEKRFAALIEEMYAKVSTRHETTTS